MNNNERETGPKFDGIEFATLGSYEPGFIHMRINTHDDLRPGIDKLLNNSDPPAWAGTFLHEYIHFLQDISSTHGLLHLIYFIEYLRNATQEINQSGKNIFSIPLSLSNKFNLHTNDSLFLTYRGNTGDVESIRYLGYRKINEVIANGKGEVLNIPKYYIDYYDNSAQTKMACHFGSIHIKEYMAHTVQNQYDPKRLHADIPYRLVELLVEGEIPNFAKDPKLIVALCDASLMDYNPAQLFFSTIEKMKNSVKKIPVDVESVYDFTYDDLRPAEFDSFDSLYEKTADLAVAHFRDSLKGDIFKNNVQWFEVLVAAAKNLRLTKRGFMTQLVTSVRVVSPEFKRVVKVLGVPFTTNQAYNGCYIPPAVLHGVELQPYLPKVFQAIIQTFRGNLKCTLHSFCDAEQSCRITSSHCLNQPWERVAFPQLCPYAQLWKNWGLEDNVPQLRMTL